MSVYQHQERIYNNMNELDKINKILDKLKTSEYYSSVCNKSIRTIDEYLKNLGIDNNKLREYFTNSALKCDYRGYDIEYVDLNKLILEYHTNLYSQLYEPYYNLFSDIKDSISILLKLYENMQPGKEEINLIQKSKYPNLEKRMNLVQELKEKLTPNIKLLKYFDIDELIKNISIKVICYIEACSITTEKQSMYQINNMINYLKNHIIYTQTVEDNCKVILDDIREIERIELIKQEQIDRENELDDAYKMTEMEEQLSMFREIDEYNKFYDDLEKEKKKYKKIYIILYYIILILLLVFVIVILYRMLQSDI